jgi:hypothetical protein
MDTMKNGVIVARRCQQHRATRCWVIVLIGDVPVSKPSPCACTSHGVRFGSFGVTMTAHLIVAIPLA